MIEYANNPGDLPYVAVYLHHGENRVVAAFEWASDCERWCVAHGNQPQSTGGKQIYTPMTRDGRYLQAKSGGHGYNILDALERHDRKPGP